MNPPYGAVFGDAPGLVQVSVKGGEIDCKKAIKNQKSPKIKALETVSMADHTIRV